MDLSARTKSVDREYRDYGMVDVQWRDDAEGSITFEGVASVVDRPYTVRDMFGEYQETITAGAFNKTLKDSKANIALYVNHNWDGIPLATRGAKTLTLTANPDLSVVADLDPVRSDVTIVQSAVRRGEMRQMSIGFSVPENRQTWSPDFTERTIHEVKLYEVSIVKDGANPFTKAAVRSLDEMIEAIRDGEWDVADLERAVRTLEEIRAARAPEVVTINMPVGTDGEDVVRAILEFEPAAVEDGADEIASYLAIWAARKAA